MKLLILTQKVDINDDLLGFMHGWVKEFAKRCEKVTVICLQKGECELPRNVKVLSLGKEKLLNCLIAKLLYCCRFYKYIWQERKNYDVVFAHMNCEYIVLGGWFWKLLGKKIGFWYAHGSTSLGLKIAERFSDIIFTSTKSGCRINSKKINVVGQGIDTEKFNEKKHKERNSNNFKIITIGRISPVKNYETLIKSVDILNQNKMIKNLHVDIIGGVGLSEHKKYLDNLKKMVLAKKLGHIIKFFGPVPYKGIIGYLYEADLFINTSHTGSLDKAIAEAMACGLPVLTCNEALFEVLGEYKNFLIYPKRDYKQLAKKINLIADMSDDIIYKMSKYLRNTVIENHSLKKFIVKILTLY